MPQTNFTASNMKPPLAYIPYAEPVLPAEFVEDVESKLETETPAPKKKTSKKDN